MATIRCWALHGNVQSAIEYIINPKKTADGELIYSNTISPNIAGLLWKAKKDGETIRSNVNSFTEIVGFHFQQSFPAGSITADEAMEISKEWIEEITGGNYDYVLSVHIDQADRKKNPHIHTHIIVNPINNKTGKKKTIFFKKDIPIFKALSDKICVQHGKDILSQGEGKKGTTYYEWMMEKKGDTFKEVVQKTIDTIIPKVKDYEEFKLYLQKLGYEVEDGLSENDTNTGMEVTIHSSLLNKELSNETESIIRIPYTKQWILVNKENIKKEGNIYRLYFTGREIIHEVNQKGEKIGNLSVDYLNNYFEDKRKKGRQGLRIKPPYAKKWIRCGRIQKNDIGEGYSLDDILKRIENNGRFMSDPKVITFLEKDKVVNRKQLFAFYEEATIKMKWQNSEYYQLSKREKEREKSRESIRLISDSIAEKQRRIQDIQNIGELREKRVELQAELKEVYQKLNKKEKQIEQIQLDKLSDCLEINEGEYEIFIKEKVAPLQKLKNAIKEQVDDIDQRIKKVEEREKKLKEQAKKIGLTR